MVSTRQHITNSTYPKVSSVDFEHLDTFDWQKAVDKEGCTYKPSEYFCEEVYKELVDEIVRSLNGLRPCSNLAY
jgi:hypothetical protein